MCSVCLQNPCDSRCPNAPEPKPVCLCSECNEGIYKGDKYLEGVNGPVCTTCLSDMTTARMRFAGISKQIQRYVRIILKDTKCGYLETMKIPLSMIIYMM